MKKISVLAIDPGPTMSGWVDVDFVGSKISSLVTGHTENQELLEQIRAFSPWDGSPWNDVFAVEMVANYGMAVGKDVFETVFWAGRFFEAAANSPSGHCRRYYRKEVVTHFCTSAKATKAEVNQAVIDHFGGNEVAVGGNKCWKCKGKGWFGAGRPVCGECEGDGWGVVPGPLHGIRGPHAKDALALGVYAHHRETEGS